MAVWYIPVVRHPAGGMVPPGTSKLRPQSLQQRRHRQERTVEQLSTHSFHHSTSLTILPGAQGYEIRLIHSGSLEEEEAPLTSMDKWYQVIKVNERRSR